jgi:hypothetical protein
MAYTRSDFHVDAPVMVAGSMAKTGRSIDVVPTHWREWTSDLAQSKTIFWWEW